MNKRTKYALSLALALSTSLALAENPPAPDAGNANPPGQNIPGRGQGRNGPPGGGDVERHRPVPPLLEALDTNGDGIISADEIANASKSLKKLDRNHDGKITPDELRPQHGPGGPGERNNRGPRPKDGDNNNNAPGGNNAQPQGQNGNNNNNPPPPPPDAAGGQQGGDKGNGNQGGPGEGRHEHRPPSPLMAALDTDGDGILSAQEIANAPKSLLTLDKNGDGQLTPDEYRPAPPEGGRGPGAPGGDKGARNGGPRDPGANNNNNNNPPQPPQDNNNNPGGNAKRPPIEQ